jgi:hypothetical protein
MGRSRRLVGVRVRRGRNLILPFLVSKCWKLPRKCVQMQILLWEASLMMFRCAKSRFQSSLVGKSRDLVGFRVVVAFLECSRHT